MPSCAPFIESIIHMFPVLKRILSDSARSPTRLCVRPWYASSPPAYCSVLFIIVEGIDASRRGLVLQSSEPMVLVVPWRSWPSSG